MKTVKLDDLTVKYMAQVAMALYEIEIDTDEPRSVQAGLKALLARMQKDSVPNEPIAQLALIKADLIRVHDRLVKESNPQPQRTAA